MKLSTAMLPKPRLHRPVSTRSRLTSTLSHILLTITHTMIITNTFTICNTLRLMVPQAPSRVTTIVFLPSRAFSKTSEKGALWECLESIMAAILSESSSITLKAGSTNKNVRSLLLSSSLLPLLLVSVAASFAAVELLPSSRTEASLKSVLKVEKLRTQR